MGETTASRPLAAITGATSGIGAEFARRLAASGYDLVITGRRREKISLLVHELEERHGTQVESVFCELATPEGVDQLIHRLQERAEIALLVNNAGFGLDSSFASTELDSLVEMLRVHAEAVVRITHAVIPLMQRRGRGAIINVSSIAGYVPAPGTALYSATKAFLTTLSEGLHQELKRDGIVVQALLPGFTKTDFHTRIEERKGGARSDHVDASTGGLPYLSCEEVVTASLRALRRGRPICIPGAMYHFLMSVLPFAPRSLRYAIMAAREKGSRKRNENVSR